MASQLETQRRGVTAAKVEASRTAAQSADAKASAKSDAADAAKAKVAAEFARVFVQYADTKAVTLAKVDAACKASREGLSLRAMPVVLAKAYATAGVTSAPPAKSALGNMIAADAIVSKLHIPRDAESIAEAYTVASNADAAHLTRTLAKIAKAPAGERLAKLRAYRESGTMTKAKADAAKARRDTNADTKAKADAKADAVAKAAHTLAGALAAYASADVLAGLPAADVLALGEVADVLAEVAPRLADAARADVAARAAQADADAAKASATRPAVAEVAERAAKADAKA